jgi:MFS family permease
MSSINAMQPFHDHFGTSMEGSGAGILFSIYAIGQLAGALVGAPASDTYGRRFGMFFGSLFIILGTIIEVTATPVGQFIGGRFLIGFGVTVSNVAGPVYLVEISPPHWRGAFGGLSHVIGFYAGALG